MKILMVEDDESIVEIVTLGLEVYTMDLAVQSTGLGLEAIEMVAGNSFDVILLDLGLPDIDGLEVTKKIRAFSTVPIIVISARTSEDVINQALHNGADFYITKPFDCEKLAGVINNLMKKTDPAVTKN